MGSFLYLRSTSNLVIVKYILLEIITVLFHGVLWLSDSFNQANIGSVLFPLSEEAYTIVVAERNFINYVRLCVEHPSNTFGGTSSCGHFVCGFRSASFFWNSTSYI